LLKEDKTFVYHLRLHLGIIHTSRGEHERKTVKQDQLKINLNESNNALELNAQHLEV
jgi:hypothetical protein